MIKTFMVFGLESGNRYDLCLYPIRRFPTELEAEAWIQSEMDQHGGVQTSFMLNQRTYQSVLILPHYDKTK